MLVPRRVDTSINALDLERCGSGDVPASPWCGSSRWQADCFRGQKLNTWGVLESPHPFCRKSDPLGSQNGPLLHVHTILIVHACCQKTEHFSIVKASKAGVHQPNPRGEMGEYLLTPEK